MAGRGGLAAAAGAAPRHRLDLSSRPPWAGFVGGVGVERLLPLGPSTGRDRDHAGRAGLRRALAAGEQRSCAGRGSVRGAVARRHRPECASAAGQRLAGPVSPAAGTAARRQLVHAHAGLGGDRVSCASSSTRRRMPPTRIGSPGFLALLYAGLQVVELACIVLFTGPVTRRALAGLAQRAMFPLGACLSLLLLSAASLPTATSSGPCLHRGRLQRSVRPGACEQLRRRAAALPGAPSRRLGR